MCFELTTSLNSDEDVVKVMGADVPLAVQAQAFPELAGLYKMERQAWQDKKDWEEMLQMSKMRLREWEIERLLYFSRDLATPHFSKFCGQNFKLQLLTHFLMDFLKT